MTNDKFRIGIIDYTHSNWQGGRNYVRNIIASLRTWRAAPVPFEVVEIEATDGARPPIWRRVRNGVDVWRGIHQPMLHRQIKKNRIDFAYYCSTGSLASVGYRSAHWIADFQSLVRPEFSKRDQQNGHGDYIRKVLRDAQQVVLSSDASRADCKLLFPEYVGKTVTVPFRVATAMLLAASPPISLEELRKTYNLPERFFVVCNQFWAHKNHQAVFSAVELLVEEGVEVCVACTGEQRDLRDGEYHQRLARSLESSAAARAVRLVGKIPSDHLYSLIRHSVALIQPSFFEGWSTSVEEAHCLGKTTLLSDIPVHREQASPHAVYFDPKDPASLANLMKEALKGASARGWEPDHEQGAVDAYHGKVVEFAERFWRVAYGHHERT